MKLENHYKFEIAFSDVILSRLIPHLLGIELTTNQVKEVFVKASKEFSELIITDGSILPNDHGAGNKHPCSCSGTERQIFDTIETRSSKQKYFYIPRESNGKSKIARDFFEKYGLKNDIGTDNDNSHNDLGRDKERITKVRDGQNLFQRKMLRYWRGCAVTGCQYLPVLIASHIKPWKDSNEVEKLDVNNGLLLIPNIDALFDSNSITFDNHGKIIISKDLSKEDCTFMGISSDMKLSKFNSETQNYLEYHRNCFYLKNKK